VYLTFKLFFTLGMGKVEGVIVYKNTVQISCKTNCLTPVICYPYPYQ